MNSHETLANFEVAKPDPIPLTLARDRLLVFGGPYSNLAATERMLKEAARMGFANQEILCTGDVVAYCGEPAQTLDLIRQSNIQVILGNCEESLAAESQDCGCGFDKGSHCDSLSVQWYEFAANEINQDHRQWMSNLPRQVFIEIGGRKLLATHASIFSINEFIFASSPKKEKLAQMATAKVDGIITGHSGIPFMQFISDRLWLNAGAIGMPANDGTDRAWYAILESRGDEIDVQIRTLSYNAAATRDKMSRQGLTTGYYHCLSSGLWPSMDVLPKTERSQVGVALDETRCNWTSAGKPTR